ncbi:DUF4251 domain-containing protein [Mucilaginibacter terrae]|uniref:DUF4251 domain-containing protein n=1 Tax=Mucilaginibacter terrae TaxID=1955052 RepID=A0ABU3GZM2_9SPHI|nr:DUF4251 domain-containing protein [Mucilaginibacter terrae]MDT3405218.1 hypothetical protein [Mucilaginibacter terrae]
MKSFKYLLVLAGMLTYGAFAMAQTQDSTKKEPHKDRKAMKAEEVKKLLDSKAYIFKAQFADPLGGTMTTLNGRFFNLAPDGSGRIYLNYPYDVRIKPDSVISFLPYFGRVTMAAGYGTNTDNGIQFTSTKFGYESKTNKKGSTTIVITPKDARYTNKMILDVSTSGYATLQVISNNKNAISYSGYVDEK